MTRTITQLEQELQEIRKSRRHTDKYEYGMFGIAECKKEITWRKETIKTSLQDQYASLVYRGIAEVGFNILMIIACEELMKEEVK